VSSRLPYPQGVVVGAGDDVSAVRRESDANLHCDLDVYLDRRSVDRGQGGNRMISDEAIAKFDPEMQKKIRLKIERLVENGRPKEFLDLWPDGKVTYNSIAHMNALELEAMEETALSKMDESSD
jgi:hypothetical protein